MGSFLRLIKIKTFSFAVCYCLDLSRLFLRPLSKKKTKITDKILFDHTATFVCVQTALICKLHLLNPTILFSQLISTKTWFLTSNLKSSILCFSFRQKLKVRRNKSDKWMEWFIGWERREKWRTNWYKSVIKQQNTHKNIVSNGFSSASTL